MAMIAKAMPARKNGIRTREIDVATGVCQVQPDTTQQLTEIRVHIGRRRQVLWYRWDCRGVTNDGAHGVPKVVEII
jgi:hypothetical protein